MSLSNRCRECRYQQNYTKTVFYFPCFLRNFPPPPPPPYQRSQSEITCALLRYDTENCSHAEVWMFAILRDLPQTPSSLWSSKSFLVSFSSKAQKYKQRLDLWLILTSQRFLFCEKFQKWFFLSNEKRSTKCSKQCSKASLNSEPVVILCIWKF